MFNKIIITGRLTAEPELKTTSNGISVCTFSIANETGWGDSKKTNFIPCTAWRTQAEFVCKYLHKGNMIGVEGQLTSRKYEMDGKTYSAYEIVASDVQSFEKRSESLSEPHATATGKNTTKTPETAPAESYQVVASDDELPF